MKRTRRNTIWASADRERSQAVGSPFAVVKAARICYDTATRVTSEQVQKHRRSVQRTLVTNNWRRKPLNVHHHQARRKMPTVWWAPNNSLEDPQREWQAHANMCMITAWRSSIYEAEMLGIIRTVRLIFIRTSAKFEVNLLVIAYGQALICDTSKSVRLWVE